MKQEQAAAQAAGKSVVRMTWSARTLRHKSWRWMNYRPR
jgi:hypothetical protein